MKRMPGEQLPKKMLEWVLPEKEERKAGNNMNV